MKKVLLSILVLTVASAIFAQEPLRKKHFNLEKGLAINGYDAVAYFKQNKAVKGKKEFAVNYQGAAYYFSSAEDQNLFEGSPAKYEPEYGGWCAYAMGAKGEKVTVDPQTFKIFNGKLFLFYNSFFNNTLKDWNKDEHILHTKADGNWAQIFH